MAVTKSWENPVAAKLGSVETPVPRERRKELWWLIASSLIVACALTMVCIAKTQNFAETGPRLTRGELLNLNAIASEDELLPFLQMYTNADERQQVADRSGTICKPTARCQTSAR